jgi:hypothetical protein
MGQVAVCCKSLTLGALSSRSALSVLVGALFKKLGLFLNTPRIHHFKKSDLKSQRPSSSRVRKVSLSLVCAVFIFLFYFSVHIDYKQICQCQMKNFLQINTFSAMLYIGI